MKSIRILKAQSGDWQGLYIDGELVMESHSLRLEDCIPLLLSDADDFRVIVDTVDENLDRFGWGCPTEWLPELENME